MNAQVDEFPKTLISAVLDKQFIVVLAVIAFLAWQTQVLSATFRPGLRNVPGPWPAKFTSLWRVMFVYDGEAHEKYRKLHTTYGPIVRTAPNVVDISDPSAISAIYGINSKYLKVRGHSSTSFADQPKWRRGQEFGRQKYRLMSFQSDFYSAFDVIYENDFMPSMFTTRSTDEHKALKRPVAQKFSMSSVKTLEYLVDPCSEIFSQAMKDLQGQVVDLGAWLQWYAFDVIGAMTFARRFGFMEQRKDVHRVISGIDLGLRVGGVLGQVPLLNRFSWRNKTVRNAFCYFSLPDPMAIVTKVSMILHPTLSICPTIMSNRFRWYWTRWRPMTRKQPREMNELIFWHSFGSNQSPLGNTCRRRS